MGKMSINISHFNKFWQEKNTEKKEWNGEKIEYNPILYDWHL